MTTEAKTGLTQWSSGATQPDLLFNAFLRFYAASGYRPSVLDKDLTTPPTLGTGDAGKSYIVAAGATGVWSDHDTHIAYWDGVSWWYFTPSEGYLVWVSDEDASYTFGGSVWAASGVGGITSLANGGTGSALTDPGADRILFWDDSAGTVTWLTLGTGLSITGTTIDAASGTSPVGRHMVPIMAAAMAPSASGGCAALATVASAANQPDIVSLDFDPTTQEYAQFAIPMPESWDEGTITFQPIWSHASTTTNFGVVWELQAVAVSNDDGIAVAYGTAQSSTDTGGTTNDIYVGPESSAITAGGTPAAGDVVYFRIARAPANGSDTLAVDARLHGIRLYITTAAATD